MGEQNTNLPYTFFYLSNRLKTSKIKKKKKEIAAPGSAFFRDELKKTIIMPNDNIA